MKNAHELHKQLMQRAALVASKHDMHACLETNAQHGPTQYKANICFIEKNEINRNWTSQEALYGEYAKSNGDLFPLLGKKINYLDQVFVVIGQTARKNGATVLRRLDGQLIQASGANLEFALLFAK